MKNFATLIGAGMDMKEKIFRTAVPGLKPGAKGLRHFVAGGIGDSTIQFTFQRVPQI